MRRNKGFTLIELIAVLVIMAIIALIVTPLVMNIVKKAKDSANKRSVDAYGKAVELAVATHLLDTGDYPTSLDNLIVEYSGNEVVCNIKTLNEDGSIYLSECSVKGTEVKDTSTEDGWYHYGKLKPIKITYQEYSIGDVVTYNGMNFYVIENSDSSSDRVTLLKETPLTVDEVNKYGMGHVNIYDNPYYSSYQTAYDMNGYGGMQFYSSSTCGHDGTRWVYDGCTTDYGESEVKYVVDAWSIDIFKEGVLIEDSLGYTARLLTLDELTNNLGYKYETGLIWLNPDSENTPNWVYSSDYRYWTMSQYETSNLAVWFVNFYGDVTNSRVNEYDSYVVRPVITILKSSL